MVVLIVGFLLYFVALKIWVPIMLFLLFSKAQNERKIVITLTVNAFGCHGIH